MTELQTIRCAQTGNHTSRRGLGAHRENAITDYGAGESSWAGCCHGESRVQSTSEEETLLMTITLAPRVGVNDNVRTSEEMGFNQCFSESSLVIKENA